jgi:hypothetical protein
MEATAVAAKDETAGRGRVWGVRVLVVLGSLLLVLGVLGVWIERVALQTPTWTSTSSQVLANPQVDRALATYLVDQLYANVDIAGELRTALPPRAKPLAGPAAAGLRNVLVESADRALAAPRAQRAWRTANETANRELVRLLNDGSGALTTTNGAVVLDLRPLVARIGGQSAVADRVGALPPDAGKIVLLRSSQLQAAQTGTRILKAIAVLLVPLVALIFALAVWLAPDRRRALRACAIGTIVAGLLLVILRRVLGDALIDRLVKDDSMRPAVHEVWWIVTGQLGLAIASVLFVGIVGFAGTSVAGSGRRSTAVRRAIAPWLRDDRCWLVLAATLLLLLVWAPTPAARNWVTVTILTLLTAIGFEALRRQTAKEFPAGETAEANVATAVAVLARTWGRLGAAPAPAAEDQRLDRLDRLAQLHRDGVLSDEEFSSEKRRVLESAGS